MASDRKNRAVVTIFVVIVFVLMLVIGAITGPKSDNSNVQSSNEISQTAPTKHNIPQIEYYPSSKKNLLDSALNLLESSCIHTKNYTHKCKKVVLQYHPKNYFYTAEKYGWNSVVEIQIWNFDNYDLVPSAMAGQTLYFYIGGGNHPGIVTGKWQAKSLCGIYEKNDDDVFKPEPKAVFIQ